MTRARPLPNRTCAGWPDQPCSDPAVEVARQVAVNLKQHTDRHGIREIARRTGVDHSIISRIISGDTWPDMHTLARIEIGIRARLWPTRHTRKGSGGVA